MRRIKLDVQFEEKDLFEKEVTDLIKSKIKEQVRNEIDLTFNDLISKEIERILKIFIEKRGYVYRFGTVTQMDEIIIKSVEEYIKKCVEDLNNNNLINDCIEKTILKYKEDINLEIGNRIEKIISDNISNIVKKSLTNNFFKENLKSVLTE